MGDKKPYTSLKDVYLAAKQGPLDMERVRSVISELVTTATSSPVAQDRLNAEKATFVIMEMTNFPYSSAMYAEWDSRTDEFTDKLQHFMLRMIEEDRVMEDFKYQAAIRLVKDTPHQSPAIKQKALEIAFQHVESMRLDSDFERFEQPYFAYEKINKECDRDSALFLNSLQKMFDTIELQAAHAEIKDKEYGAYNRHRQYSKIFVQAPRGSTLSQQAGQRYIDTLLDDYHSTASFNAMWFYDRTDDAALREKAINIALTKLKKANSHERTELAIRIAETIGRKHEKYGMAWGLAAAELTHVDINEGRYALAVKIAEVATVEDVKRKAINQALKCIEPMTDEDAYAACKTLTRLASFDKKLAERTSELGASFLNAATDIAESVPASTLEIAKSDKELAQFVRDIERLKFG